MIYLDNAATTPLCYSAKKAIISHLDDYGNPSSSYEFGRKSLLLIEDAREKIAKCINAEPDEIYFTSGGSEANTWALNKQNSLSTNFEHHSVNASFHNVNVNNNGMIDIKDNASLIKGMSMYGKDAIEGCLHTTYAPANLLSCMYVNNEIGTVQHIKEIAELAHKCKFWNMNGMLFHTDAVQAVGHIPIDVKDLNIDMLSASGHKFGAPKGVGFLYVKSGVNIPSLIYGGKQEHGLRGGTENIIGIIAMAAALEESIKYMHERNEYIEQQRDKMLNRLLQIEGSYLNGSLDNRVVSNINIRFDGVPGQRLVTMCDLYGICISSGSACNEGQATPSHVLKAIGLHDEDALNSIRITLGYQNTEKEIDYATEIIANLVERIRNND